ncbi:M48 family metalloprotease [Streptomyces sp. GMY02]|uniref:M48 family metalloprotease n=1 Tax=Streptomyces sp. GMY02 TaxID=1333528 RepID=UPI001C2C584C|nr:M48 family metalloprotease [Streptomyces sp. GMY02]QXE38144.1 M48 family metalloprotease [Streptomyces sp. GMY02]
MVLALQAESLSMYCADVVGAEADMLRSAQSARAVLAEFDDCREKEASRALRTALSGTGVVLCTALVVYWTLPSWRRHRRRLIPAAQFGSGAPPEPVVLAPQQKWQRIWTAEEWHRREDGKKPENEAPGPRESLTEHLSRLTRQGGIRRPPSFVVDVGALSTGAVVFGRGGRHTVCLDIGLVILRDRQPKMFQAVVLHELAHLRNGDVDITYVALSLWRVYLSAVLLPCQAVACWLLMERHWQGEERIPWKDAEPDLAWVASSVLLTAMIYLTRADALRRRELVADLDAVAIGADPAMWHTAYRAEAVRATVGPGHVRRAASRRWFTDLWRTHPTWKQRHETLVRSEIVDSGSTHALALLCCVAGLTSLQYALLPFAGDELDLLTRAILFASLILFISFSTMTLKASETVPRAVAWYRHRRAMVVYFRFATMSMGRRLGVIAVCICCSLFAVEMIVRYSGN